MKTTFARGFRRLRIPRNPVDRHPCGAGHGVFSLWLVACLGLAVNACVSTGPKADLAGAGGRPTVQITTIRLSEELQPERPLVEMHLMAGFSRAGMDVYFLGGPSTARAPSPPASAGRTAFLVRVDAEGAPDDYTVRLQLEPIGSIPRTVREPITEQSACNSAPRCPSFLVALETLAQVAGVRAQHHLAIPMVSESR